MDVFRITGKDSEMTPPRSKNKPSQLFCFSALSSFWCFSSAIVMFQRTFLILVLFLASAVFLFTSCGEKEEYDDEEEYHKKERYVDKEDDDEEYDDEEEYRKKTGKKKAASVKAPLKGQEDFEKGKAYLVAQDYKTAVMQFALAANQGHPEAQYYVGLSYAEGKGVEKDMTEAVKWFKQAAEQGNADAMFKLGLACYEGDGMPLDLDEAAKWFRKAAEHGNADAREKLDSMKEILALYESAKKGSVSAIFNLGAAFYFGKQGMRENKEEAIKWWKKAAEAGLLEAQYNLGAYYHNNHLYYTAAEWYRKAAEQGNAKAMNTLGFYYEYGEGVRQDTNEAIKWYTKAAEKGNADAMYNLGSIYMIQYDLGGKNTKDEAIKWYRKAAALGNTEARDVLREMGIRN